MTTNMEFNLNKVMSVTLGTANPKKGDKVFLSNDVGELKTHIIANNKEALYTFEKVDDDVYEGYNENHNAYHFKYAYVVSNEELTEMDSHPLFLDKINSVLDSSIEICKELETTLSKIKQEFNDPKRERLRSYYKYEMRVIKKFTESMKDALITMSHYYKWCSEPPIPKNCEFLTHHCPALLAAYTGTGYPNVIQDLG